MKTFALRALVSISLGLVLLSGLAVADGGAKRKLMCRGPLGLQSTIDFSADPTGHGWSPQVTTLVTFHQRAWPGFMGADLQNGECSWTSVEMKPADGSYIAGGLPVIKDTVRFMQTTVNGQPTLKLITGESQVAESSVAGKLIGIDVVLPQHETVWEIDTSVPNPIFIQK